ncbi:MAG TPA: hypothetical protein VFU43_13365 [Streptosporangiaceae bacterium]|nr:hypothetical protein [Streptosporangiaceae bacterium]
MTVSDVRANLTEDGSKRRIDAAVVKVLKHRREDRGMRLEPFASRCVRAGEVHELVTTDQADTTAGARVDRVGFLGFAEIANAGVIDRGDRVLVDGTPVGTVLGFDACHFPNHYNVLILTDRPTTGPELAVKPETKIAFVSAVEPGGPR